jgi:hypothetical protein
MDIFTVQDILALNSVVRIIIFIGSIHGFSNKAIPLATHIFSTMHVVRLVVQKRVKVWDQFGAVDCNRGKGSLLDNGGISLLDATSGNETFNVLVALDSMTASASNSLAKVVPVCGTKFVRRRLELKLHQRKTGHKELNSIFQKNDTVWTGKRSLALEEAIHGSTQTNSRDLDDLGSHLYLHGVDMGTRTTIFSTNPSGGEDALRNTRNQKVMECLPSCGQH